MDDKVSTDEIKDYPSKFQEFLRKEREEGDENDEFDQREYFEQHNVYKHAMTRSVNDNQDGIPIYRELAPFTSTLFQKPLIEDPYTLRNFKGTKLDSFRGWWFGKYLPLFVGCLFFPLLAARIYTRSNVKYVRAYSLIPSQGFRRRYSLTGRTNKIYVKNFRRWRKRTWFRWFKNALFFGFYTKFVYPWHTSLPTKDLPPVMENIIHAGWIGLVPGFFVGLIHKKPFILSGAGFVLGALFSFGRSTDSWEGYRRTLLETKARLQNRDIRELEIQYPIVTRAATGYYVDKTYKPIDPKEAQLPFDREINKSNKNDKK